MVFESIVVDVLNKFLGNYVQNLDPSQLKLGIWGGDVALKNLLFKENALDDLNLPVKAAYGQLEKLTLNIPWKNIYTEPVKINIDGLSLLIVPKTEIKYDAEKEKKMAWEAKQQQLKKLEEAKRIKAESKKPRDSQQDSFTEKLIAQIIKNLQVKINNIHVRYEDKQSNPGRPFAFGFTLYNLSFESTDENWKIGIDQGPSKLIFKLITLSGFAVYWNCMTKLYLDLKNEEKLKAFKHAICHPGYNPINMHYVLGPINSTLKLQMNPKPEQDGSRYSIPKIMITFIMEEIAIGISKYQYQDILILVQSLDWMEASAKNRKYKPAVPLKGNAKVWWTFAYEATLHEDVRRRAENWSWDHIRNHRNSCREYKELYRQKLYGKKLANEAEFEEYEKSIDIFNLSMARKQADMEFERSGGKKEEEKKSGGWFGGWFGGKESSKKEDTSLVKQFEDAMTADEKAKLCEAIGYQENVVMAVYPVEFVENKFAFELKKLRLTITNDAHSPAFEVLCLVLNNVGSCFEQRPSGQAMKAVTKVESLTVTGIKKTKTAVFTLISTQNKESKKTYSLLDVLFETNPLDGSCDQRLHISSRPLEIVYHAETINELATVFKPPKSVEIYSKLQAAATETFAGIKEVSTAGFQYAIEHHKYLDVNLDLKAPYIIVPENGIMTTHSSLVLLDMGSLKLQSMKREQTASHIPNLHKLGKSQEEITKEMIAQAYDKYTISLVGIQILFAASGDNWMEARNKPRSNLHIWQPTNVKIHLEKSVILDDPRIPKLRIHGSLPTVHITLSDAKVLALTKLAFSIPTPKDEEEEASAQPPLKATAVKTRKLENQLAMQSMKKSATSGTKSGSATKSDVQVTNLDFKFEIKEMQLRLTKAVKDTEKPFLNFTASRLGISMQNKTFCTLVTVYLGDINFTNMQFQTPDGNTVCLVQTHMKKGAAAELLSIGYTAVNKMAPTFHTTYHSTLQTIDVNFATLTLLLHQEALLSIMEFNNNLMAEMDKVKQKAASKSTGASTTLTKRASLASLQSAFGDVKLRTVGQARRRKSKGQENIIDLKVTAKLGTLGVEICNNLKRIVAVNISGLEADVMMEKAKMTISNSLKKIEIIDSTVGAMYPKILSIIGDGIFDTKIVIYHTATKGKDYLDMTKVDTSVAANIGCIRIVFLNKFVMDCVEFLSNFQAATESIKEATVKAAEAAMENVTSVYQKASRIQLSIDMKAPVIVMPRHSTAVEVLLLDMGQIKVFNKFAVGKSSVFNSPTPPILESMHVELKQFKMTRALINPNNQKEIADCLLLEPTSFSLKITRNLSAGWCKDIPEVDLFGKFKPISLTMSQEDYCIIMRVLNENLNEVSPKTKSKHETSSKTTEQRKDRVAYTTDVKERTDEVIVEEKEEQKELDTRIFPRYKFNVVLDSIKASLYFGTSDLVKGTAKRLPDYALTYIEIQVIAVKGEMLTDGSLWANVIVVNFIIDDVRHEVASCFPRMLDKKTKDNKDNMIDVTFRKDAQSDIYVDVKVRSFYLVACPNYLVTISTFFTKDILAVASPAPLASPESLQQTPTVVQEHSTKFVDEQPESPPKGCFVLVLAVDQPDIILVEDESNPDTDALILNTILNFKMKSTPRAVNMSGVIDDLQIYSCCLNPKKREATKREILGPCEIRVTSSNPREEGMHTDIDVSDIELHLAPHTVRLLASISSKFTAIEEIGEKVDESPTDLSNLWQLQKISDCKFWFLSPEVAVEAIEISSPSAEKSKIKDEQLILKARTILITVEIGIGNQAIPLLLLEAGLFVDVRNWSSALDVTGGLTLEMLSYNEKLALWEPFIERIDNIKGSRPWELTLEVKTSIDTSQDVSIFEQDLEEVAYEQPKMSISVIANDIMDLCITKTSLEVITNLGQAFSDAVHLVHTAKLEEFKSPFLIRNDTGLRITLLLKSQDITDEGWEWALMLNNDSKDLGKESSGTPDISEVILEHNTSVPLTINTSRSSKAATTKKSVLKLQEMTNDKQLLIKVVEMNASRHISVKRADKRFFQLPQKTYPGDQWGLVSDVKAMYGCKIITLRSVVQIKNNFQVPIEIYYMATEGEELMCSGIAEPAEIFNVPIHAVYTTTNEIFFRPKNESHSFSSTSFTWKELIKNPTCHKRLECPARTTGEKPFYINVIGEIDQIFFEDSKKKTLASTCYILNLKPTAVITNYLPVQISCCDQDMKCEQPIEGGESTEIVWAEIDYSTIIVKLNNYLGKVWSCTKKLELTVSELSVWSFETVDSPKIIMDLGVYSENDHESLSMSVYCPFWMINKTGLHLHYKADDVNNVISHPPDLEGPVLFSFRAKNFFARKKASLKIDESDWSDKFSIDVVGSSGTVKCLTKGGVTQEIGVQIKLTKVKLTKIIVFTPYFLMVNNCSFDVEFLEITTQEWIPLASGECLPFWPKQSKTGEIAMRVKDTSDQSKFFPYNEHRTTLLQLNNKYGALQVDCQVNESSTITTFSEYIDGSATVRLVNCLDNHTVIYHQSGEKDQHSLKHEDTILYTWDDPSGKQDMVFSIKGTKEIRNDLLKDSIGEMTLEGENPIYWVLFLDNAQRTLLFTDDIVVATRCQCAGEFERADLEIILSFKGLGIALVDNINKIEVIYLSISSSGVVWEASKEKSRRYKSLNMTIGQVIENAYQKYMTEMRLGQTPEAKLFLEQKIEVDFNNYMMLKPQKRRIRRCFQTGLWLTYKSSAHRMQLHAKINRIQIDNHAPDCVFRVILAPVLPPKTVAADSEPKPFMEVSIMMRKSDFSTLRQYKYFKVLIQEFHIKIDQPFVNGLLAMLATADAKEDPKVIYSKDMESTEVDLKDVAEVQMGQDPPNFYDLLHFSPLKVHISFSMQGFGSSDSSSAQLSSNFVNLFVQSVGVTLTEIQDVVFKLAYFERQNKFITQGQLINEAVKHYSGQAIKQMYVLVLGLDVIGNPFGLVIGLTRGVEDLFYEPIQGAIQGPEEFAEGLALGVKSLFGHAVGGAAGAVSRITGTLGKGVAALTLDEDYQKRRREAQLHRSGNFQEGLAQSGKGLVMGVFDGVTGVFVKPIEGAKEEGVEGFFKGMGKGVVGLVTRPTAGVIDFASGTFDSVKRIAENTSEIQRMRAPRFFQPDGVVRPYNQFDADGYKLLLDVEKGKFATTDNYISHAPIPPDGKHVILITDKRVILVTKGDIFGQWNCDWQVTWDEMKGVPSTSDKGIVILLKEPRKKKLGLFGSGDNTRTIHLKNPELAKWVVEKIEEAMEKQE